MAYNIDRQALLSCLDEISEYFDTIETVLLGLTAVDFDPQKIDSALRAAHTIKGLGGMIGCKTLGGVSHNLEDYLKIIKVRQQSLEFGSELQTWLLQMLDCMRQMSAFYRQGQSVDEAWLTSHVNPILQQIHGRLGNLTEGDETALLAQQGDTDVIAVMFKSEVEGLLQRLEQVLMDPMLPCLREELDIIAQELMDLGQMLDLGAFIELCSAIHYHLTLAPDKHIEAIARQAVKDWRRTQSLILLGQRDSLPRQFDMVLPKRSESQKALAKDDVQSFAHPVELSNHELSDLKASVFNVDTDLETAAHDGDTRAISSKKIFSKALSTERIHVGSSLLAGDFSSVPHPDTEDSTRPLNHHLNYDAIENVAYNMAYNIDRQTLLSCLDEINEYFGTIETILLGFTAVDFDPQKIDGALRAAHTIKGLGGMIGCGPLSKVSHNLEDYLKIIKVRHQSLEFDSELQTWLLQMLDCMRQMSAFYRQEQPMNEAWLTRNVAPILQQIHGRLGNLTEGDETALLAQQGNTDVIAVVFESEVEGLLQRLEQVLVDPMLPCLREELDIIAQELMDLGQMLDLEAFIELCSAIHQHLAIAPDAHIEAIARQAVKDWRRTQALVLLGQRDNLPRQLGIALSNHELSDSQSSVFSADTDLETAARDHDTETPPSEKIFSKALSTEMVRIGSSPLSGDFSPIPRTDSEDSTVRVPVDLLMSLNDLFGELLIQRNTFNSRLEQLDGLVNHVDQQAESLEKIKDDLQQFSHQRAVHTSMPPLLVSDHVQRPAIQPSRSESTSTPLDSTLSQKPPHSLGKVFDALEMDRYSQFHLIAQDQGEAIVKLAEANRDINLRLRDIKQANDDIERTVKELQIKVTRATMRPLADVVKHFPRLVRDLSARCGKQVDFQVRGSSTLVDRHVLDALSNPLIHLLRNAFDHGIEAPEVRLAAGKSPQGKIDIWANHQGNQTLIFIQDDGAGINLERIRDRALNMGVDPAALNEVSDEEIINLIFEPGFSTASQVTDLSGRGVGMDVVRTDLMRVRGDVKVHTRPGEGTTFTISVPFTLSTLHALLIEVKGIRLAFPTDSIREVIRLKHYNVHETPTQDVLDWEGLIVPLIRLDRWLTFNCPFQVDYQDNKPIVDEPIALLIQHEGSIKGIYIDKFWGEREIFIRQVEATMSLPPGFIGCTILEDGHVIPLADTLKLIDWVSEQSRSLDPSSPVMQPPVMRSPMMQKLPHSQMPEEQPLLALDDGEIYETTVLSNPISQTTILVVDDSINVRRLIAHTLEQEGYRVEQAKDGQEAIDKLLDGLFVQAVLCDIEMPRLDGFGFLARIKAELRFEALPIVMLTSRSGDKHRQLAKNLGATDYLTKPYEDYQLLNILDQLTHSVT